MKILHNCIKDQKDEWLAKTLLSLNNKNHIIDRIADDTSILAVTFTNQSGAPLYSSITLNNASEFGRKTHSLGFQVRDVVRELNVLDEAMVLRVLTKKYELLMVPHDEFNALIVQQPRSLK